MADNNLTLHEKLLNIQHELKAPKNLHNSFGNYNYRNAESILEALKPLLIKYAATVTITETVEEIGGRVYVKATGTLYDIKTGEKFCAKISNKDWSSEISYKYLTFDGCDANTAYLKLEAFDLIESLEAGELSGELKTIAEGLKEDDNPVLMVVKFKE